MRGLMSARKFMLAVAAALAIFAATSFASSSAQATTIGSPTAIGVIADSANPIEQVWCCRGGG